MNASSPLEVESGSAFQADELELTWLGQSAFHLRTEATGVLIDPWFSDHSERLAPTALPAIRGSEVDYILVTHEHVDHFDEQYLMEICAKNDLIRVILPRGLESQVDSLLGDRIVRAAPGDSLLLGDIQVHVTPAAHALSPLLAQDMARPSEVGDRFVGFVLATNALTIYHSGDTTVTALLIEWLQRFNVDVALLPINGRDFFREERGVVGNMTSREAVEFAKRIGARILVPTHWDAVRGNTERPGTVADEAAGDGIHVLIMARCMPFLLRGRGTWGRIAPSEVSG